MNGEPRRRANPPTHNGLGRRSRGSRYTGSTLGRRRWRRDCAVASPERCKRVARLLEPFCSQLVRDSTWGIKVAQLTRDDQLGPQELKKFRLITKQNKGARRAGPLLKGPPGFVPPFLQSVTAFLSLPALPGGGAHEPCPGNPSPYPDLVVQGKSNSFHFQSLSPGSLLWEAGDQASRLRDPASPTWIPPQSRNQNILI